jgi:hypothetical protein
MSRAAEAGFFNRTFRAAQPPAGPETRIIAVAEAGYFS